MYTELSRKLAVTDGNDAFSPAVEMNGDNAVQMEATIFNLGGATSLSISIEGSNDGENFSNITTNASLVLGYSAPAKSTAIALRSVRLRYSVVGTGTVIVAAGVNTSFQ